ncbi:polyadenylate-binding protein 1A-like [Condylostylus longicornis]|uniref:polyadenylate-binding protein 1A-like n=1 Tax=Condylostylus longicornis TaxID=2530218 RepID=UPI00244DD3A2|nr:polyadenylate-binding protein 1A-like [Condylostylus longicornis]
MAAAQPQYASASLYVGDLAPEVNETMLFEIFNAIGPVASIRVCRESGSRKSLGYAYVNYHNINDAERALDTLNFTTVKGVPCRIMWSHRDPSLRKSGAGNIFVKNLDKSIDNKSLYDTFSLFGNILSCKVATDEYGKSRGYGFVHYEGEESAKAAIEKVNGMLIGSKHVYVGPFKRRNERLTTRSETFTNLYVKHFPEVWTEDILRTVFSPFGEITSLAITTDNKGRRFGFVNYESCDAARAAVNEIHGKKIASDQSDDKPNDVPKKTETKPDAATEESAEDEKKPVDDDAKSDSSKDTEDTSRLYVQRAMTKAERIALLKEQFTTNNAEKQKQSGVNLYVKNLDDQVIDDALREAFSKYGTVTSAKVMRDEAGVSKGFGFVCFAFPEDATKAVTAMHLKIFMGKPLYVGLAEKRDHRIARLQHRFRTTRSSAPMMSGGSQMPQMMHPYGPPMYYGGAQGPMSSQRPVGGPGMAPPNSGNLGWRNQGPRPYNPQMSNAAYPYHPMGPMGGMTNPPGSSLPMRGGMGPRPRMGPQGSMGGQPSFKFTPQARNRDFPQMAPNQSVSNQQPLVSDSLGESGDLLSAQSLAAAHPRMQKQMLGEKLFPLVSKHQPELAGKITGMMLEMDNAELLSLLESETQLQAKVDEALGVLHRHQAVPPSSQPPVVNPAA